MKKITTILAFILLAVSLSARNSTDVSNTNTVNKTNIGSCNTPTAQVDLDINNVRVRLLSGGDMWWDGINSAKYQYPKIDETTGAAAKNVLFNGVLWLTGYDEGNSLRCASQLYRSDGYDFYTGPLQNFGLIEADVCQAFDRHFIVYGDDIKEFKATFQLNGSIGVADIHENILHWPGKGNPYLLGSADATVQSWYFNEGSLAPFFDNDGDGIYDPVKGDYPVIKVSYDPVTNIASGEVADQMIFWVMNDEGNSHTNSNGADIGIQINCLAFAFRTVNEINDMTFYTYEIIKKTAGDLNDTYMSIASDPDIGDAADDYIGCDTVRNIGYCFNGDGLDGDYGVNPPLVGIDFFEGPIDVAGNELGLSTFMYFNIGAGNQGDPTEAQHYRNYQTALWKNNSPLTNSGNGFNTAGQVVKHAYPDNPGLGSGWAECIEGNPVGDRRFILSSGPFKLTTSQAQRISVGVMIAQTNPSPSDGCVDFDALMGSANNRAQSLFDNNFGILEGPDAPKLKIRELTNELVFNIINETTSNNFAEKFSNNAPGSNSTTDIDTAYNFEGYIVYQLVNSEVTGLDLNNPLKAKIVFQADVENQAANVFNYVFDDLAGMYVPELKVEGANLGISRTFKIEADLFATGDDALVNNKPYYFGIQAYAYNNFKQFEDIDPTHETAQLEQFLPSSKFDVYSAIPHDVSSENSGTVLNSVYGQGVEVKRLEGRGNGGNSIVLTDESSASIVQDGFVDIITYKALADPLGFKIIDPLSVQNVDFELRIKNDFVNLVTDSSYWEILVSKDGAVIDTIVSNRVMDRPYEQIVEDYGIALKVGSPIPVESNYSNGESVFNLISTEISYADENEKWLGFFADEGALDPSNWIGSGSFEDVSTGYLDNIFTSHQYDDLPSGNPNSSTFYDENDIFANMFSKGFAPYCLASNFRRPKSQIIANPETGATNSSPYSTFGPAFNWDLYNALNAADVVSNPVNTLDKLQSVDIVMTSDKSKWSKCVVFETAELTELSIGGAKKGQLRQSESIDEDGDVIVGETGMSFFPGYAINIETGERLNIAFGESSDRIDNNGGDMIWNPTSKIYDKFTKIFLTDYQRPAYGGKHFIYVFDTRYDEGDAVKAIFDTDYNTTTSPNVIPLSVKEGVYDHIMYTTIPLLKEGFELLSLAEGIIPVDDTMKVRVQRPFEVFYTNETDDVFSNDSMPRYSFSTKGLAPEINVADVAKGALDYIRVVPNPYYAFSAYEDGENDNRVKITNLPDVCDISIYTLDGKLVKKIARAVGSGGIANSNKQDLSLGQRILDGANLNNSQVWNLKNHKDIPVASGTYLIYVSAPGIGIKVVKSVVFVRPPDITNF